MSDTGILMIILHNSTLLLTVHEEGICRFLWSIGIPVFIFVLSSLAFLALFYSRWVWTSKLAREERWRNWFWECFGNYFWKKFNLAGGINKFRAVNKISDCWEYAISRPQLFIWWIILSTGRCKWIPWYLTALYWFIRWFYYPTFE